MVMNRAFLLDSRPVGAPAGPHNFKLVETPVPQPAEGEILVRHHWLSLDPYMRGRMNDAKSYATPQKLGDVMIGGTVGEVVDSRHPRFKAGDMVVGMGGWQLYSIAREGEARRIDPAAGVPPEAWLGPAGMPGVTAWVGLETILQPKPGETLVVSAATGAVGTVVGQLAKMKGARVVGIAGGPDKCRIAVEEFGFDACVDHRAEDFAERFADATEQGVDCTFENVGGLPLDLALARCNPQARIAICGLVASGYDGSPTVLRNIGAMLAMRVKMQGFIVSDDMSLWPAALKELAGHVAAGRIRWRKTVAEGLEAAPDAFFAMLKGGNVGKQLVKLA